MTRAEDVSVQFVTDKRAANASWGAIARMAGVPELSLRKRFDPTLSALLPTARPKDPRDLVASALIDGGAGPDEAAVIARIWLANGRPVVERDAVRGHTNGGDASEMMSDARTAARRQGVTIIRKGSGFTLPPADIVKLSERAGIKPEVMK